MEALFENVSLRFPQKERTDLWIGFKIIYRQLLFLKSPVKKVLTTAYENKALLYESTDKFFDSEPLYVGKHTGEIPKFYFSKEQSILYLTLFQRVFALFLMLFSLPFLVMSVFSKKKLAWAMLISQLFEIASVSSFIHKNRVDRLYDFVNYEIDSNLLYLFLKQKFNPITHYKIPSPNSLKNHNHILFCDVLALSTHYQIEELDELVFIYYQKIEKWHPEYALNYIHHYKNPSLKKEPKYGIGFYSHGSWIRKQNGDADIENDILYEEELALAYLNRIKQNTLNTQNICIFLHPHEKKAQNIKKAKQYYKDKLSAFTDADIFFYQNNTALAFDTVNVGVGCLSSIVFERLFAGFKTIVCISENDKSLLKKTALHNIRAYSYFSFEKCFQSSLHCSHVEFFKRYNLEKYHHTSYPELKEVC